MNFNIDFGEWVVKMLEKYESSKRVRFLVHWLAICLTLLCLASFINAIKWRYGK